MNNLRNKINRLYFFILLIAIPSFCISVNAAQKKADAQLQFINILNKKAGAEGTWEFLNSGGWKISADKNDNISIRQENYSTPDTTTLLSIAVMRNWPDAALFIIKKGGNVNAPDSEGETPLHKAAYLGINNMVKLLVSKGAKVNAANHDGMTPLHLTVFFTRYESAAYLLGQGADINALNNNGETPLFILRNYITGDKKQMEQLLAAKGGTDARGKPSANKNTGTGIPGSEAAKLITAGITKHNEGKYEEAIRLYMRVLRISIGQDDIATEAYYRSAESKLALKNFSSALIDIDMAIYLNGPQCRFYKLREKINRELGQSQNAGSDLKKLKEMNCAE